MSYVPGAVSAALLVGAAVSVLAAPQRPTQQPPVFRTGVDTVAVYATVLDRYGEMVLTLEAKDFQVFDNRQRQTLTVFVKGLQPITAMLLIDTSASMSLNLDLAKAAAEQFVIRMLPGDRAGFGTFSDRVDIGKVFTSDRDELLRALRGDLHFGNRTRLWDGVEQAVQYLTPLGGRRVIVLLTDGLDTMSQAGFQEVFARVRTDELMIYVVEFRATPLGVRAEIPLRPSPGQVFGANFTRPGSQNGLRRLTQQTGGGHFLLDEYDDINTTFTRVMQELHYQYVLGFTPERLDGRLHDLETRVEPSTLIVRARRTYLAPKAGNGTAR